MLNFAFLKGTGIGLGHDTEDLHSSIQDMHSINKLVRNMLYMLHSQSLPVSSSASSSPRFLHCWALAFTVESQLLHAAAVLRTSCSSAAYILQC